MERFYQNTAARTILVFTFLLGCVLEKRIITMKRSSVPYVFGQGILQTTIQYVCFYIGLAHTTGAKGSVINASNAFFSIIAAHFLMKSEKLTFKKIVSRVRLAAVFHFWVKEWCWCVHFPTD